LLVAHTSPVSAWGPDGHRIVCRIAYQLLDAPRQAEINRLTRVYRTPDNRGFGFFTDGCLFPDDARVKAQNGQSGWERFARFSDWHFLNVPRTARELEAGDCNHNCVLEGITTHSDALRSGPTDKDRAEALFFLGHWVGDIHQPLHISYKDDKGGNDISPINGGFYSSRNLHAVWDSGILVKAVGTVGWRIYADRLAASITPAEKAAWSGSEPIAWAQESYNLATRSQALYCAWRNLDTSPTCARITRARTLAQPYQQEFEDDVAQRLQQAGARLAELLRPLLATSAPN
jgi:hypothetical protein